VFQDTGLTTSPMLASSFSYLRTKLVS
jgi:hypothetical protein